MLSPYNPPLLAVVDVNIIIRGTLSATGGSALILEAIRRKRLLLITSRTHLSELYRVLARPRMRNRYGITARRRKRLITRLATLAAFAAPQWNLHICRDPKDDYLIEMALVGHATHLVSVDEDLQSDIDIRVVLQSFGVRLVSIEGLLIDLAQVQ